MADTLILEHAAIQQPLVYRAHGLNLKTLAGKNPSLENGSFHVEFFLVGPADPVSHGKEGSLTRHLRHGLSDELLELQPLSLQLLKVFLERSSILSHWEINLNRTQHGIERTK